MSDAPETHASDHLLTTSPATSGVPDGPPRLEPDPNGPGDLSDLLTEIRLLLQDVQVLTGFLVILPFSEGFRRVTLSERQIYLVLFFCSLTSLVLLSAPAAQHRLLVPLVDRVRFKRFATRIVVIGLIPLSGALVLASHLVVNEVGGSRAAAVTSGMVAALLLGAWWIMPLWRRWRRPSATSAAAP